MGTLWGLRGFTRCPTRVAVEKRVKKREEREERQREGEKKREGEKTERERENESAAREVSFKKMMTTQNHAFIRAELMRGFDDAAIWKLWDVDSDGNDENSRKTVKVFYFLKNLRVEVKKKTFAPRKNTKYT